MADLRYYYLLRTPLSLIQCKTTVRAVHLLDKQSLQYSNISVGADASTGNKSNHSRPCFALLKNGRTEEKHEVSRFLDSGVCVAVLGSKEAVVAVKALGRPIQCNVTFGWCGESKPKWLVAKM